MAAPATIIIPTRGRPGYLAVTLASIVPQARAAGAEVVVVDDGRDGATERTAAAAGARYVTLGSPRGANAARNTGAASASGDLLIFVDDDIEADPSWLDAYLRAAAALPEVGVFGGPIRARLEGFRWHTCGRERPQITHADHGPADRDIERAWSANLAIRRSTFDAVGQFDERYAQSGEEDEWEERYVATGGRIRYVAAAGVDHRRAGRDATLRALARLAFRRGYASRRYDETRGDTPSLERELRTLAGCVWHTFRRRCANGPVMSAHSAGRLLAALTHPRQGAPGDPVDDFLSGESGTTGGKRDALRRVGDLTLDLLALPRRIELARAARQDPPRRNVLVISATRQAHERTYRSAVRELRRSRHAVTVAQRDAGTLGRFENFNLLLAEQPVERFDWLILLDDDVVLPRGFLDGLLHQAERHELAMVQPAHRLLSHAAWRVTRRRAWSAVRETVFVEQGPVLALKRETFATLLPFPSLQMGWGIDAHWAALARAHAWRIGVVDVLPVAHRSAKVSSSYSSAEAVDEARSFLADHTYLPAAELQRTLAVHRRSAGGTE